MKAPPDTAPPEDAAISPSSGKRQAGTTSHHEILKSSGSSATTSTGSHQQAPPDTAAPRDTLPAETEPRPKSSGTHSPGTQGTKNGPDPNAAPTKKTFDPAVILAEVEAALTRGHQAILDAVKNELSSFLQESDSSAKTRENAFIENLTAVKVSLSEIRNDQRDTKTKAEEVDGKLALICQSAATQQNRVSEIESQINAIVQKLPPPSAESKCERLTRLEHIFDHLPELFDIVDHLATGYSKALGLSEPQEKYRVEISKTLSEISADMAAWRDRFGIKRFPENAADRPPFHEDLHISGDTERLEKPVTAPVVIDVIDYGYTYDRRFIRRATVVRGVSPEPEHDSATDESGDSQ
jgi:molecular chaperone GrpE (heat shock protein)